jgi:hypothetical protein
MGRASGMKSRRGPDTVTAARLRVRERGGNKPLEIIQKSSVDVPEAIYTKSPL